MEDFLPLKRLSVQINFSSYLNIEKSGVYNSISKLNKNKNYFKKERCEVVSINSCIDRVIKQYGKIDLVKIDNEGEELKTVASIDTKYCEYINCLNVDGESVREYVPRNFSLTKLGSAQRYYKNE